MKSNKVIIHQLICDDPWFSFIKQGIKPVEGRKNSPKNQKIKAGDFINFSNGSENFLARVIEIRRYSTLEEYLTDVTYSKALPGISSFDEAREIYLQWSKPEEIRLNGFLGIFIKPEPISNSRRFTPSPW